MEIMTFGANALNREVEGKALLDQGIKLTKMALGYSAKEDYDALNDEVKKAVVSYSAKRANVSYADYKLDTEEGFSSAMSESTALREAFFSVVVNILDGVNSKATVEQALMFTHVGYINDGDSATFDVAPKALFDVEETGYSNNVSRLQYQFHKPTIIKPVNHEASVAMDLYQMNANGFDFGRLMAKIILSFQRDMYKEIIDAIFDTTNYTSSPFYSASFAQTTWRQLASKVQAANGVSAVVGYGSLAGLGKMTSDAGDKLYYQMGKEILDQGYVKTVYGVLVNVINQAVDPNSPSYNMIVPDDKIILTTATDKICKTIIEGKTHTIMDDGLSNATGLRNVKFRTSYKSQLVSQSAYGIQKL